MSEIPGLLRERWKVPEVVVEDAPDPVEHPSHYTRGKVELIELIEDLPFSVANVIKYTYRAGYKDQSKELEDFRKARFYLNRLITAAELRHEQREDQG